MTALIADLTAKIEAALDDCKVARDEAHRQAVVLADHARPEHADLAVVYRLTRNALTECEADLRDALGRVL